VCVVGRTNLRPQRSVRSVVWGSCLLLCPVAATRAAPERSAPRQTGGSVEGGENNAPYPARVRFFFSRRRSSRLAGFPENPARADARPMASRTFRVVAHLSTSEGTYLRTTSDMLRSKSL